MLNLLKKSKFQFDIDCTRLLSAFSPFFHLGMKNYNPDKDHDFTRGGQASEANSTEAPTPAPTTVATTVATTIETVAVVEE